MFCIYPYNVDITYNSTNNCVAKVIRKLKNQKSFSVFFAIMTLPFFSFVKKFYKLLLIRVQFC